MPWRCSRAVSSHRALCCAAPAQLTSTSFDLTAQGDDHKLRIPHTTALSRELHFPAVFEALDRRLPGLSSFDRLLSTAHRPPTRRRKTQVPSMVPLKARASHNRESCCCTGYSAYGTLLAEAATKQTQSHTSSISTPAARGLSASRCSPLCSAAVLSRAA